MGWRNVEKAAALITIASAVAGIVLYKSNSPIQSQAELPKQNNAFLELNLAMQNISRKAVGSTGKKESMEYVIHNGKSLEGIDLSCTTMGGEENWKAEYTNVWDCRNPVILESARFAGTNLSGVDLRVSSLMKINWTRAKLVGANFASADLSNGVFLNTDLKGSWNYNAKFNDSMLYEANFSHSFLQETVFDGSNLSGTVFTKAGQIQSASFKDTWSWSDMPPIGLDLSQSRQVERCQYKENLHDRLKKPKICIK